MEETFNRARFLAFTPLRLAAIAMAIVSSPSVAPAQAIRESGSHWAAYTGNEDPCETDHPIVRAFESNMATIQGFGGDGRSLLGQAIWIASCQRLLTVGHNFYEKDQRTPLARPYFIVFGRWNSESLFKAPVTARLVEGPWQSTKRFSDEVATLYVRKPSGPCARENIISDITADRLLQWSGESKTKFYALLRTKEEKLCAQRCDVSRPADGKYGVGSVQHNCNTWPGLSGAPIFMTEDGYIFLVGLHVGPDPNRPDRNLFAPLVNFRY